MVGDTTHDLQLAANAGTPSVGGQLRRARAARPSTRIRPLSSPHTRGRAARTGWRDHALSAAPRVDADAIAAVRARRARGARPAFVFDVLLWSAAGARLRAALRGPRRRLPEPLRPRAGRDGLAARRIPRRRPPLDPLLDPRRRLRADHRPLRRRPVRARPPDGDRRRRARRPGVLVSFARISGRVFDSTERHDLPRSPSTSRRRQPDARRLIRSHRHDRPSDPAPAAGPAGPPPRRRRCRCSATSPIIDRAHRARRWRRSPAS